MKNYLMIYVGSRGCLEGIEGVGIEDIEGYLNGISEYNKDYVKEGFDECDDEDYVNEVLGYWDWSKLKEGVWEIGLGDEESKYYIDVEMKEYKEWDKDRDLNDVNEKDIEELLRVCLWEWSEREDDEE
jgi:hypothetical protein